MRSRYLYRRHKTIKRYRFNTEKYIFGLEGMYEHCRYMLECEIDSLSDDEIDYYEKFADECEDLLTKNSYVGLTDKEVQRVKDITLQRETIRYNNCIEAGMGWQDAEKCFE